MLHVPALLDALYTGIEAKTSGDGMILEGKALQG